MLHLLQLIALETIVYGILLNETYDDDDDYDMQKDGYALSEKTL